ncbi:hypothetical protein GlitD10_1733 [Gloeomargarita lithophora Alchichica-D10]|uniref:Uncharacterized protein n=1 Tax=Gloeomargarita lithophora Alchichica-D10 TaxID=1188229 RepID=A0A1J0ADS3_9CYAN|nr:hypothetical protein [Gloeomargarita lithophora]APB34059.1 hypothetical protein GlitD10_1733 [Gloeomargarita lithophora Alchichica-D10]
MIDLILAGLLTEPPALLILSQGLFSGQTSPYSDSAQGYRLRLPVEFQPAGAGSWSGPRLPTPTTIYVHTEPMSGSAAAFNVHFKKYKDDPLYTNVTAVNIRGGQGFRAEEVVRPGKSPDDLHRWFLFVYANERAYTVGMTGPLRAFQQGILPPVYGAVINSFEVLPR